MTKGRKLRMRRLLTATFAHFRCCFAPSCDHCHHGILGDCPLLPSLLMLMPVWLALTMTLTLLLLLLLLMTMALIVLARVPGARALWLHLLPASLSVF